MQMPQIAIPDDAPAVLRASAVWPGLAAAFFCLTALPAMAQTYKIAVIGLVHSHYGGYLPRMAQSQQVKLVGIAETIPDLVAEAKQRGAADVPFFDDYRKMLDQTEPDIVWAFVENNRHLEILKECAPRHINVIYEKPLASTYEVFGRTGSLYMMQQKVELRTAKETTEVPLTPLPPEAADPIAFMVDAIRNHKPIEGITALDINLGVAQIIEAAKESVKSGRAVKLP
jgi:predicted dehydrogenase